MSLSMFCLGAGSFAFSSEPAWKPKSPRLRVGRDISPLTQTCPIIDPKRKVVIGEGDDVRIKSHEIFSLAKDAAKDGNRLKNFRTLGIEGTDQMTVTTASPLYESNTRLVYYSGGALNIYEKDDKGNMGELLDSYEISGDCRLSWDANGNHIFSSGSGALTNGRLAADSGNEILIRTSGVQVEAGRGTTVLNLSSARGEFKGGSSVTYLGFYEGCTITGASGDTVFAGYFADSEIDAAKGRGTFSGVFENTNIGSGLGSDVFSGYFLSSRINGGDGTNTFSGMFLQGCEVNGGKDADHFQGRFVDSTVKGNEGDDKFGTPAALDTMSLLKTIDGEEYRGLESDFINSDLDGGEGDDHFDGVAWGSTVNMGEGNDKASGVFSRTTVIGGEGDDTLGSMFSLMSSFETGTGNDSVALGTADTSSVYADEGSNDISLGHNEDEAVNPRNDFGGNSSLLGTKWQTRDEYFEDPSGKSQAKMFGELDNNKIEADRGENRIHVHRGPGTQTILTGSTETLGDKRREELAKERKEETDSPTLQDEAGLSDETFGATGAEHSLLENSLRHIQPDSQDGKNNELASLHGEGTPKMRRAAERYMLAFGDTSQVSGAAGAVINTGTGEALRIDTEDRQLTPDSQGSGTISKLVRKYTGYGTYVTHRY